VFDALQLREHFAAVLPNGQDDIESVRLIRDRETLEGKGIGYLWLKVSGRQQILWARPFVGRTSVDVSSWL
jgi:hypothetical protein